jgi:hypothetical protein
MDPQQTVSGSRLSQVDGEQQDKGCHQHQAGTRTMQQGYGTDRKIYTALRPVFE